MFLQDIEQMRQIEWGKTYLWDVLFPAAPAPFNEWFPATDVTENLATLNEHQIEGYMSTYSVPLSTSEFDINLTFVDDINHTLATWLGYWINTEILNKGSHISTLAESVKMIIIAKLDGKKQPVNITDPAGNKIDNPTGYWVYPSGAVNFEGNSESGLPTYQMALKIAGIVKSNNTQFVEAQLNFAF